MFKNHQELQDIGSSAADPRAATPNGGVSPHPVSTDTGPCKTSQDLAFPRDRFGVVRNIVLFEGPAPEVHHAVAEIRREYRSATTEPPEETARHRQLIRSETDGLPATVPADAITLAVRFETAPPRTPPSVPIALIGVKAITDRWRRTLTTGHVYFDTRLVGSAVAMVYCAGPSTGHMSRGLIGSLGGHRQAYFRLKRHFYDDDDTFFRDVVSEAAEALIEYPYRPEWREDHSPLRLQFMSEDPSRHGWGLADGSDSAAPGGDFLVKNGFLPPEGVSVSAQTNWLTALTLLAHATNVGIYAFFDDDGQMMISGYALCTAGLIDAGLKPIVQLSETDRQLYRLGSQPTEETAMLAVLNIYAKTLGDAIADYIGHGGTNDLVSRLARHQVEALSWLAKHADSGAATRAGYYRSVPGSPDAAPATDTR